MHYVPFFFPLDDLLAWNRIYGPRGLLPVPVRRAAGRAARCDASDVAGDRPVGLGSFLAVLKTFGERPAPGC